MEMTICLGAFPGLPTEGVSKMLVDFNVFIRSIISKLEVFFRLNPGVTLPVRVRNRALPGPRYLHLCRFFFSHFLLAVPVLDFYATLPKHTEQSLLL